MLLVVLCSFSHFQHLFLCSPCHLAQPFCSSASRQLSIYLQFFQQAKCCLCCWHLLISSPLFGLTTRYLACLNIIAPSAVMDSILSWVLACWDLASVSGWKSLWDFQEDCAQTCYAPVVLGGWVCLSVIKDWLLQRVFNCGRRRRELGLPTASAGKGRSPFAVRNGQTGLRLCFSHRFLHNGSEAQLC